MLKTEIDLIEEKAKALDVDEDEVYYSLRYGEKRPSDVGIDGWSSSMPSVLVDWLVSSPDVTLKLVAYVRKLERVRELSSRIFFHKSQDYERDRKYLWGALKACDGSGDE